MMRKLCLLLFALVGFAAYCATYTPAEVPDVHRADRRDFVANPDGILSPAAVARLNVGLDSLRRNLTVEPMVVAVDNIADPDDPSDFATELFTLWGLGKADKDNGLLVLIVKDQRKVTIRPGYGLEGALPDVTCARIIRDVIAPAFREGNYDLGTLAAVNIISEILADPENASEYFSKERDVDQAPREKDDIFPYYLRFSAFAAVLMLVILLVNWLRVRKQDDYFKYRHFIGYKPFYLILTFAGLGIPAIASVPLLLMLNHWRNHGRKCPNCGTAMKKIDEVHDNDYLTPAQDLEEKIGSVDYDVWVCPNCNETDVIPYTSETTPYVECDRCHARTARLINSRIIRRPTTRTKGQGAREYECLNCHHHQYRYYDIEPEVDTSALAAGAILGSMLGSGGRGGGGFGGGSFGGGFGGGSTGGGGATGGW